MTFESFDVWWWPFLFILIGGWLATDSWRFLGVFLGERLREDSDLLVLVRCIATALVAAVISRLILAPGGPLADVSVVLRIGAVACGFVAYVTIRRSVLLSIIVAEVILVLGMVLI